MRGPRPAGAGGRDLAGVVDAALGEAGVGDQPVVVALSGGLDSVVLLHVLRFGLGRRAALRAAHLDHGMRPGSAADAAWVRGLCRAWSVPLDEARATPVPGSEAEARAARYAFLRRIRAGRGAARVVTAHHADDQAETVLFRLLRGSGTRGLRGILPEREDGVLRPLLDCAREELGAYAARHGIRWREDPTNRLPYARNVIRHEILPRLEATVAPDARARLVELAREARADEAAWARLVERLAADVDVRAEPGGLSLDRAGFAALPHEVGVRLLRSLAGRVGGRTPGRRATATMDAFARGGASGRGVDVGGGVRLARQLDRLVLARGVRSRRPGEGAVQIEGPRPGTARLLLGTRAWELAWGTVAAAPPDEAWPAAALAFPLRVRAWRDGDRIRHGRGTRKLKKVFLEARVPAPERREIPVLEDAAGRVLAVSGLVRARAPAPAPGEAAFHFSATEGEA